MPRSRHTPPSPSDAFWKTLPLNRGARLLVADANGLAAFAKPAGVLSHPNEAREKTHALLDADYSLEGEYYEWAARPGDPSHRLWLLNRLDSGTSGVILLAAGAELAAVIRTLFRQKHVKKIYHALVFGVPPRPSEIWRDRLAVRKAHGHIRTSVGGNIESETRMRVVRAWRDGPFPLALLQLEPRTGRSHQLRVQCAQRHLPIVGDATYGHFEFNRAFARGTGRKRLHLHSSHTEFAYVFGGGRHAFSATAPLPSDFAPGIEK